LAKAPKLSTPGCIFKPKSCNRLYIKFRGKQYATGLRPNKQGYALAKALLEKKYLDFHNLKPEIKTVTFAEAWDAFKNTLIQKAIRTVINYQLAFNNIVTSPNDYMNSENIENLILQYLKSSKHSKTSVNSYLNQFQIFLNFCSQRKWIDKINYKGKYAMKTIKGQAKSYNKKDIDLILNYYENVEKEFSMLIEFMLETGARCIDALTLQWTQIDIEKANIEWVNKRNKLPEKRPVSNKAIAIIKQLQIKNKSKVFSWAYSSATNLNKKLNKCFEAINIEKNKRSMQEFRVTFRMRMKEREMPEDLIEYLLRHSTGKLIYNHYTDYEALETKIRQYLNEKGQL